MGRQMKDLQYDHLARFIGVCVDPKPYCAFFTEYCPKGSLQDILENEDVQLDSMFKMSLMHDIVKVSVWCCLDHCCPQQPVLRGPCGGGHAGDRSEGGSCSRNIQRQDSGIERCCAWDQHNH